MFKILHKIITTIVLVPVGIIMLILLTAYIFAESKGDFNKFKSDMKDCMKEVKKDIIQNQKEE